MCFYIVVVCHLHFNEMVGLIIFERVRVMKFTESGSYLSGNNINLVKL